MARGLAMAKLATAKGLAMAKLVTVKGLVTAKLGTARAQGQPLMDKVSLDMDKAVVDGTV